MKSWVEVSGARLVENLRAVQAVAGVGVEVLAVVKANGYGHDAALVAKVLVDAGARWLGVSDVEEGAQVRQALGQGSSRLLVMCGMETMDAPGIVAHGLTPVVWTVQHVVAMEKAARAAGQRVCVHLEIDTGMARQGASAGPELAQVLDRLAESRWVSCEGVMSHLSSSEVVGSPLTELQRERFAEALMQVGAAGVRPEFVHLGNTSAVDEGSTMGWVRETAKTMGAKAMVRTGLAVYGETLPMEGEGVSALGTRLKPAMEWKTRVIGVREVKAGATVGYGATFVAKKPMRLALLPVGYADGFRRAGSSTPQPAKAPSGDPGSASQPAKAPSGDPGSTPQPARAPSGDPGSGVGDGWVMIGGKRAAIVGRVSMNLMTVDVTGRDVGVGDEVVLLGEGVSAQDQAGWSGTIAYDVLCGVRARFELV